MIRSGPSTASTSRLDIRNPATGEAVGSVAVSRPAEVEHAIHRAREAQAAWSALPFRRRAAVLARFHDLLVRKAFDRTLDIIQDETGKARRDALAEVLTVAGAVAYYLARGRAVLRPERRRPAVPGLTTAEVIYKPHGVVGMITPWNFPFLLVAGDAAAALLAGNAVVVKPSELTPFSAERARALLVESGLDERLFQVVHGTGAETGGELLRHVDYVVFTGGTATGRIIARTAAERLIPYSLELGGKNPMIVTADARIPDVVTGLIAGAFSNSGQSCITSERIYVEKPVYDEFVREAVTRLARIRIGWSRDLSIDMGSLISTAHHAKVLAHIDDAVAHGAQVLSGGRARPDLGPHFVEPTLLAGVDPSMQLFRDETFGPVAAVYPVADVDEAVRLANDTEYGLNASVWAGSRARGERIARRIDAGSTGVNSTLLVFHTYDVGMGGVKASGIGRRHGPMGLRRFVQSQSVFGSLERGGGYDSLLVRADGPGWQRLLQRAFRWRRHLPGLR